MISKIFKCLIENFTDEMWNWIVNIAGNNISDLSSIIKLLGMYMLHLMKI
jgi:hypothetical protein